MLLKDDKKGLVTIIMKKMKGHGDMSPSFESSEEAKPANMKEGAEQDYESGYDACCTDMMSAIKENNPQRFKSSLKSFISMIMDEEDKE